jgi:hypothetical protein
MKPMMTLLGGVMFHTSNAIVIDCTTLEHTRPCCIAIQRRLAFITVIFFFTIYKR